MKSNERYFHKQHLLSAKEHKEINRYIQICAQFYNLHILTSDKVLEVGASDGEFSKYLKGNYSGIDIEPASDQIIEGTIFSQESNTFNVILYNHVLEHIMNIGTELIEIVRTLKPQGKLIINVPDCSSEWAWKEDGHYILFNQFTLQKLLEHHGFEVQETFKIIFREQKVETIIVATLKGK
jgi:ubiquinone/menaquinone biosynthesis C-methylase UbiE